MWSPPDVHKDLEAGAITYCRPLPRRATYTSAGGGALARRLSTFHPSPSSGSASAIPFSWECRPGIPKAPGIFASPSNGPLLPLPPSLRSGPASCPRKKRLAAAVVDDPFAAALVECAKCPAGPSMEELFSRSGAAVERRRRASSAISDRLGLLGLHAASCKAACAVSDSAVYIPRPGPRSGSARGSLNRRRAS